MATFKISPATSFSFRIETGAGTINSGAVIANNYLHEDHQAFYNSSVDCPCVTAQPRKYFQLFTTSDTVQFQVEYSNGKSFPTPVILDQDDNVIEALIATAISGNYYDFSVDFAGGNYSAGNCYRILVYSDDTTTNYFTDGDTGTMESGVAGLQSGQDLLQPDNTIAQSAVQAYIGTYSALVTACPAGTPNINHKLIIGNADTSTYTLVAGATYRATMRVYIPSGAPWAAGGTVFIDPTHDGSTFGDQSVPFIAGWSDATVHSTTSVSVSSQDGWQKCEVLFTVGADTTGCLILVSSAIPTADGQIYIDEVKLYLADHILEATSEPIEVKSSLPCYQKMTWTSDQDGFGIGYTNSIVNSAYFQANFHQYRWIDPQYDITPDSNNNPTLLTTGPTAVSRLQAAPMPFYMLEKLIFAAKHPNFKINGARFSHIQSDVRPEWSNNFILAELELDLVVYDYDYHWSRCG